jgi:hypothetical protein
MFNHNLLSVIPLLFVFIPTAFQMNTITDKKEKWEIYQIICFGSFPTISELIQLHWLKIIIRNWNDKISIIMWCDFVYYLTSSQVMLDPEMIISDMKSIIREVNDRSKLAPMFDFNLINRSKQQIWQFNIIWGRRLWWDNYHMVV